MNVLSIEWLDQKLNKNIKGKEMSKYGFFPPGDWKTKWLLSHLLTSTN